MPLQQKKHDVFFNTKTKVYRTGAMALRLEKHTLFAQRKKHTLHTGGTTRDARRSTTQNAVFCEARRGAGCAKHPVLWALQRAGGERPRADSTPRRMRRTVATVRRKAH